MVAFIGAFIFVVAGLSYSILHKCDEPAAEEIALIAEDLVEDTIEYKLNLPHGYIEKELTMIEGKISDLEDN